MAQFHKLGNYLVRAMHFFIEGSSLENYGLWHYSLHSHVELTKTNLQDPTKLKYATWFGF